MRIIREHSLPLIGFIITLVLVLISDFVLDLAKESTFIIFAIGSTLTVAITLLKAELVGTIDSRISRVLELYNLYGQISDPELRELASDLEFQDRLVNAKSKIRTSAVENESLAWRMETLPIREVSWYRSLQEAINRGCHVEEIHIVDESKVDVSTLTFRSLGHIQDERVQKYIMTREEATKRGGTHLLYNFTVVDDEEVLYQRIVPGGGYDTIIDKSPAGIRQFVRRFDTLKKMGTRVLPD